MGNSLRNVGVALVAAWLVMLLTLEYLEMEKVPWHQNLFSVGLVLTLGGILIQLLGRARGAVIRRRCVRCRQSVQPGQAYCAEHFHEAIDRIRDRQRETSS